MIISSQDVLSAISLYKIGGNKLDVDIVLDREIDDWVIDEIVSISVSYKVKNWHIELFLLTIEDLISSSFSLVILTKSEVLNENVNEK